MDLVEVQIEQTSGQIKANFEEVKQYLAEQLEEYKTAVFTDDSIKAAKSIVADLRKQQQAVKGRISDVKKFYMKPFEEFKVQADELVELYNEPINFINGQVVDYTERLKEEKRVLITSLYQGIFADLGQITLESIYNPRWENATYKKSEIEKDLLEIKTKADEDIQTLLAFNSDVIEETLEMYYQDRNMVRCIANIQHYEKTKNAVLEKERQAREEEIRNQERERILAEQKAEEEKQKAIAQAQQELIDTIAPQDTGATTDYIYSLSLTEKQKEGLEIYFDSVGIEWEVLNG